MGFGSDLLAGGGVLAVLLMSAMSLQCAPPSSKRAEAGRAGVGPVLETELAANDLARGAPGVTRISGRITSRLIKPGRLPFTG